jgi:hypothetical protein
MSKKESATTVAPDATAEQLQAALAEAHAANAKLTAEIEELKGAAKQASKHAGAGTHVRVSSAHKAGQHYRAGRLWTRDATDVHKDEITTEQLAAMRADAQLVVVDL